MQQIPSPSLTGSINDDLDRLETLLGRIGINSLEQTRAILPLFDAVSRRIDEMEPGETRERTRVRFESVLATLQKQARRFLKDLGGLPALAEARARVGAGPDRPWYYLDQYLNGLRKAALRRTLISLGILAAALVVLGLVYRFFLAPDPSVSARYQQEQVARDAMLRGDYPAALAALDKGLASGADDPNLLVLKGVTLEMLKRPAEAEQTYALAEKASEGQDIFLLNRSEAYSLVGLYDRSKADVDTVLQANPDSAQGYMYLGQIYERTQRKQDALDAYNKAFDLANKQQNTELAALARMHYAMLLQTVSQPTLPIEGTPTP